MAKLQHKESILKAAREKKEVTYKGAPIRLATTFQWERSKPEENGKTYSNNEKQRPASKTSLPSKALNQDRRPNKELPRQKKSKTIQLHQTSSARDAKGIALRKGRKRERERKTRRKKCQ